MYSLLFGSCLAFCVNWIERTMREECSRSWTSFLNYQQNWQRDLSQYLPRQVLRPHISVEDGIEIKSKLLVINEVLVDRYYIPIHSSLRRNYNSSQNVAKFVNTSQVEKIHIFQKSFYFEVFTFIFLSFKIWNQENKKVFSLFM